MPDKPMNAEERAEKIFRDCGYGYAAALSPEAMDEIAKIAAQITEVTGGPKGKKKCTCKPLGEYHDPKCATINLKNGSSIRICGETPMNAEERAEKIVADFSNPDLADKKYWNSADYALANAIAAQIREAEKEGFDNAEFWKDIILDDEKTPSQHIKDELHDYKIMLKNVPTVYDNVTGGLLSKPLYEAEVVVDAFNDYLTRERQEAFEEGFRAAREKAARIAEGKQDPLYVHVGVAKLIRAMEPDNG